MTVPHRPRRRLSCPMKAKRRVETVALSDDDARVLRCFERLLVALVVLLVVAHGCDRADRC